MLNFSANAQNKTIKTIGATTSGEVATLGDKTEKTAFGKAEPVRYIENRGSKGLGFGLVASHSFNNQNLVGLELIYRCSDVLFFGAEGAVNVSKDYVPRTGSYAVAKIGAEFPSSASTWYRKTHLCISAAGLVGAMAQYKGREKFPNENGVSQLRDVQNTLSGTFGGEVMAFWSPTKHLQVGAGFSYLYAGQNRKFARNLNSFVEGLSPTDKQQVLSGHYGDLKTLKFTVRYFFPFGKSSTPKKIIY